MAEVSCEACEILEEQAISFLDNGVTTSIANRLKDDKGFSSSADVNTDCEALNNANDCLIYGMVDDLEKYDVCDIKTWLSRAWDNLYSVLKAMIMAICGLWSKVHCILSGLNTLLTQLSKTDSFAGEVHYLNAVGAGVTGIKTAENLRQYIVPTITDTASQRSDFSIVSTPVYDENQVLVGYKHVGSGSQFKFPADGVAIVGCCAVLYSPYQNDPSNRVVFYTSSSANSTDPIPDHTGTGMNALIASRGLHLGFDFDNCTVSTFSMPLCTAIPVTKDSYLRCFVSANHDVTSENAGDVMIHQIFCMFIPNFSSALNVDQDLFDSCGE